MNNKQITNNKTLDNRNPPPLTVSCAPSGDEGPTVYIQTNERKKKKKKKQSGPRADNNPGGLLIFELMMERKGIYEEEKVLYL
jgi:hypothetical protein